MLSSALATPSSDAKKLSVNKFSVSGPTRDSCAVTCKLGFRRCAAAAPATDLVLPMSADLH